MQAQGAKTYAGRHNSGAYHHFTGKHRLDVHLLKPSRLEVVQEQLQEDMCEADIADQARWIECKYRRVVLRIPLSAGFQQNSQLGLVITMVRSLAYLPCVARNGLQVSWTPSYCTIWSRPTEAFGCIEWENEHYSGRPKARCYPFDLPGHRWRGRTCQVSSDVISYHDIIYHITLWYHI